MRNATWMALASAILVIGTGCNSNNNDSNKSRDMKASSDRQLGDYGNNQQTDDSGGNQQNPTDAATEDSKTSPTDQNVANTDAAKPPLTEALVADHLAAAAFDKIPAQYITAAKQNFRIFYGHTSHGNQLMVGARILAQSPAGVYKLDVSNFIQEYEGDLGSEGDISWATTTREELKKATDRNMVMWSWCGGVEGATEQNINQYLNAMNKLEQDYPNIRFIYMTGHLNSSGDNDGSDLHIRNKQIRDFCRNNKKILFDFADIESYDPAGTYYPNGKDSCEWCDTWCKSHSCPSCSEECDHSHCFNCYLKGKAFWWMMARLAGWDGN